MTPKIISRIALLGGAAFLFIFLGVLRYRRYKRQYARADELGLKGGLWGWFRFHDCRYAFVTLAVGVILLIITVLAILSLFFVDVGEM